MSGLEVGHLLLAEPALPRLNSQTPLPTLQPCFASEVLRCANPTVRTFNSFSVVVSYGPVVSCGVSVAGQDIPLATAVLSIYFPLASGQMCLIDQFHSLYSVLRVGVPLSLFGKRVLSLRAFARPALLLLMCDQQEFPETAVGLLW